MYLVHIKTLNKGMGENFHLMVIPSLGYERRKRFYVIINKQNIYFCTLFSELGYSYFIHIVVSVRR